MLICNDCGNQEPEEAVFCSNCGKSIIKDGPARTENKLKLVKHQELIRQGEEESSAMRIRQKAAPHTQDNYGDSGHQRKRRRRRYKYLIASQNGRTLMITLILVAALVVSAIAGALKLVPSVFHPGSNSPHQITVTTYEIPEGRVDKDGEDITLGPDGNLWFTEFGNDAIGRITPGGQITEYLLPTANGDPLGITAGPDGNLWFTELDTGKIGRITPGGQITEYPLPTNNSFPKGITKGPDGNLWFTEGSNRIGRITPGGQITEYPLPTAQSGPYDIIAGPDGNLWFTEFGNDAIGRITPSGQITEYPFPTPGIEPRAITVGPDGNLWFTEQTVGSNGVISGGRIGRMTPNADGQITEFSLPTTEGEPKAITAGPNGNLWFVDGADVGRAPGVVGQITPNGLVTFPIPKSQNYHLLYTQNYQLVSLDGITAGSDGNLWMTGSTSPNWVPTVLPPQIPNGTTNVGGIIMRMTL